MAPIPAFNGLGFSKQAVLGHQQWGCTWFFSSSSFSSRYVRSRVSRRQTDTGDTSARLPRYFRSGDLYTSCEQQIPVRADERRVSGRISAWVVHPGWQSSLMPRFVTRRSASVCTVTELRCGEMLWVGWGSAPPRCHQGCEHLKCWKTTRVKEDAITHSLLTPQFSKWCH